MIPSSSSSLVSSSSTPCCYVVLLASRVNVPSTIHLPAAAVLLLMRMFRHVTSCLASYLLLELMTVSLLRYSLPEKHVTSRHVQGIVEFLAFFLQKKSVEMPLVDREKR
jgi:hypothetical protein